MDSFADRVKARRAALGLKQGQVAKLAGLKQPDVSKIELGRILETTKLLGLARALQCNPDWLSTGKGPMELSGQPPSYQATEPVYLPTANTGYDPWTLGAIAIMSSLKEYQREGALAALKMYVAQLGPPRDGQALQMAG